MKRRYWNINLEEMLEAGVYFGHGTRKWNPKMASYISAKRKAMLKPSNTAGFIARMIGKRHKELEKVKYEHALDSAALLSANEELHKANEEAKNKALIHADEATKLAEVHAEKVKDLSDGIHCRGGNLMRLPKLHKTKQEFATTCDEKNKALSHADEATKLAEVHAEKVKSLSAKIVHLKTVLEIAEISEKKLVGKCLKLSELKLENESDEMQIEDLKSKNKKYESMLDDAKREINSLTNSKAEVEKNELYLTNTLKRSEEEKSCMEFEISRLTNLLKKVEKEALWKNHPYQEANSEAIGLKKVDSDAKDENASLIIRESELEKNDELPQREMALLVQVKVLSNLLGEILAEKNKQEKENGETTDSSEKDYELLPKWTSFMQINEKHLEVYEVENSSGKLKNSEEKEDYFSELDMEMWESL